MLLGQALAAITLPATLPTGIPGAVQTSQIVFQQGGTGNNRVDLLSTLLGDVFQDSQSQYEEVSPWRDLQCLQRQLAQLLGRTSPPARSLMLAQMPFGEVHAFLSQLHAATSQLGVGISEMSDVYASSTELPMQQVLQFASTLDTAAHTFRNLATSMRGNFSDEAEGGDRTSETDLGADGAEGGEEPSAGTASPPATAGSASPAVSVAGATGAQGGASAGT